MKSTITGLLLLILGPILAPPCAAVAQTYLFHYYDDSVGLPSSSAMGVAQDSTGVIWIATRSGVARYDGHRWQVEAAEKGVASVGVADVAVDHEGTLWALASPSPLRMFHRSGEHWHPLPPCDESSREPNAIDLTLGRDHDGSTMFLARTVNGAAYTYVDSTWHKVVLPEPRAIIHGSEGGDGSFLLATSAGLVRVDLATGAPFTTTVAGPPPGPVYGVMADTTTDTLFLAGPGWLGRLDVTGFVFIAEDPRLQFNEPKLGVNMARDALGGLYVGGRHEVFYHDPARGWESIDEGSGLPCNGASDILIDREGLVWLTSLRGVSKLVSRRFANYDAMNGLFDNEVTSVLPRADGSVVLGHRTGLTFVSDTLRTRVVWTDEPEPRMRIMDLMDDGEGGLWIAGERMGVGHLDAAGRLLWSAQTSGYEGAVYALARTRDGTLWVGTGLGLFRQSGGRFARVDLRDAADESATIVRRLKLADDGALWVATLRKGVARVDGGSVTWWRSPGKSNHNNTYGVLERSDGEVWVATAGGLMRLAGDGIEPVARPAITRTVYSLMTDDRGLVWIGTDLGVRRWDGRTLDSWTIHDGLSGNEINRDALAQDTQGQVWIGTDRGVSVFDQRHGRPRPARLALNLMSIEADGQRHDPDVGLDFVAGHRDVTFHFAAPAFRDEERLRFRTWLEPYEPDWSEPTLRPTRAIRYTNLPTGEHLFHVQALDVEGNISAVATSGPIVIRPPVWRRWWFVALLAVATVVVVGLVVVAATNRRYARLLQKRVAARTEELQTSERGLRAESRRLAAVLDSISDGVLVADAGHRIVRHNRGAARLLGVADPDLRDAYLNTALPGLHQHIDPTAPSVCELPYTHPGEGPRQFEISAAPLRSTEEETAGHVVAFRDMTDRHRIAQDRERAQRLESLGLLAGGIAHDFNNLLTIMAGNAMLAGDLPGIGDVVRTRLDNIGRAADRAQGLTSQLLTFARGGAPRREATDVGDLLREHVALTLSGTNVVADVSIGMDLQPVSIDRNQIGQVVGNMLINACQAMAGGGTVGVSAVNGDGPEIVITITDQGPGIAPNALDRIFEPYFTTKPGGTGLGLAVAYSIVDRHDGSLVAKSSADGASFIITLPASSLPVAGRTPTPARPRSASGRILVLDDEEGVRKVLEQLLADHGMDCDITATGESTVAAFAAAHDGGHPYSAVLLDLTVPGGMGGRETLSRLKEIDPDVRAVVISGYSHDPVMSDHARFGFRAAVQKPFTPQQVLDALADAVV